MSTCCVPGRLLGAEDPAGDEGPGLAWRSDRRALVARTPPPLRSLARGSGVRPDLGQEGRGMEAR